MSYGQNIIDRITKAHIAGQIEGEAAERKRILKIVDQHIKHRRGSVQGIALEVLRSNILDTDHHGK